MMNGKSPSRDLGGGSTPVLKTAAHTPVGATRGDNATTQVLLPSLLTAIWSTTIHHY